MANSDVALSGVSLASSTETAEKTDRGIEAYSAFETILNLACQKVDAIRQPNRNHDRRASQRSAVALRARCCKANGISNCLISDINRDGMCLVSGQVQEVGDELTVGWSFGAGSPSLRATCLVKRVSGGQIGVAFSNLGAWERRNIVDFLQNRRVEETYSPNPKWTSVVSEATHDSGHGRRRWVSVASHSKRSRTTSASEPLFCSSGMKRVRD